MKFEDRKPETLEEIIAMYGKALAVIDDETGELKVMTAGSGAHSVDLEGKPKKGTPKPKGDGFLPDEDDDEEEDDEGAEGGNYTEKELKLDQYLELMDVEDFDNLYPEDCDEERAEELKVFFDVGFAFARRALTGRRKKKRKKKKLFKDISDDTERKAQGTCWEGYVQVGMKRGKKGKMVPNCVPVGSKSAIDGCCPEDLEVETKAAKKKLRDPKGGLTAAGRAHFKKKEGANLKPGVKGAADTPDKMRRKGSFLTRFFTNPSGPMKDEKGRPTRLALSAAAWGEAIPQNTEDAAALASKGRKMLERYENSKKKDAEDNSLEVKAIGQSIGQMAGGKAPSGTNPDEAIDGDMDGMIFDGTPQEQRKPYKKGKDSLGRDKGAAYEKRRRAHVKRELARQGIKRNKNKDRTEAERLARTRARAQFDDMETQRERTDGEGRMGPGGGPPKSPYVPGKPADRYPVPPRGTNRAEEERMERLRPKPKGSRAEEERMERMRPADNSNQRAEDARNRAKRKPAKQGKPADRYPAPKRQAGPPAPKKKPNDILKDTFGS